MLTVLLLSSVLNINTPDIPTDIGPTNPGIPKEIRPVDSCEDNDTKPGCSRRDIPRAQ